MSTPRTDTSPLLAVSLPTATYRAVDNCWHITPPRSEVNTTEQVVGFRSLRCSVCMVGGSTAGELRGSGASGRRRRVTPTPGIARGNRVGAAGIQFSARRSWAILERSAGMPVPFCALTHVMSAIGTSGRHPSHRVQTSLSRFLVEEITSGPPSERRRGSSPTNIGGPVEAATLRSGRASRSRARPSSPWAGCR